MSHASFPTLSDGRIHVVSLFLDSDCPAMVKRWPEGKMNGPAMNNDPNESEVLANGRRVACRILLGLGFDTQRPFSLRRGVATITLAQIKVADVA